MSTRTASVLGAFALYAAIASADPASEPTAQEILDLSCHPNTLQNEGGNALCLRETFAQVFRHANEFSINFDGGKAFTGERLEEIKEIQKSQHEKGVYGISLSAFNHTCLNQMYFYGRSVERYLGTPPQGLLNLAIHCAKQPQKLGEIYGQKNVDKAEGQRLLKHLQKLETYYKANPVIPESPTPKGPQT